MQKTNNVTCWVVMMYFSRCRPKDFCNLPGVTKLIINEQDITVRTCKKNWIYHVEIIWKQRKSLKKPSKTPSQGTMRSFLVQIPLPGVSGWTWKAASHWRKSVWSKADGRYSEKTCICGTSKKYCDGWWTMIDKRAGEVLDPEVDSTYWKDKLSWFYSLYRP